MPLYRHFALAAALTLASVGHAVETTIQNDSFGTPDAGTVVGGFVVGEQAASWLTSTVDGKIVAVQVLWSSSSGGDTPSIQAAVHMYAAGTFPNPGALRASVVGPVLTDQFINEWRFLDELNTVPISLPILSGQKVVVALEFDTIQNIGSGDASVVRDAAIGASRNAIKVMPGGSWISASTLGVTGDFVIRAVVNSVKPDPPSGETPVDAASGIATTTILDWADTPVARTYDVYLWRASDPVPGTPTATGLVTSTYTPSSTLLNGTTYNWRVTATNLNGTETSPVWSFTTAPGAAVEEWTAY